MESRRVFFVAQLFWRIVLAAKDWTTFPTLWFSLSQWLNFKLFGITYLVGKIKFKLFFSGSIGWVRIGFSRKWCIFLGQNSILMDSQQKPVVDGWNYCTTGVLIGRKNGLLWICSILSIVNARSWASTTHLLLFPFTDLYTPKFFVVK